MSIPKLTATSSIGPSQYTYVNSKRENSSNQIIPFANYPYDKDPNYEERSKKTAVDIWNARNNSQWTNSMSGAPDMIDSYLHNWAPNFAKMLDNIQCCTTRSCYGRSAYQCAEPAALATFMDKYHSKLSTGVIAIDDLRFGQAVEPYYGSQWDSENQTRRWISTKPPCKESCSGWLESDNGTGPPYKIRSRYANALQGDVNTWTGYQYSSPKLLSEVEPKDAEELRTKGEYYRRDAATEGYIREGIPNNASVPSAVVNLLKSYVDDSDFVIKKG